MHVDLSLHASGKSYSLMVNPTNMPLIYTYYFYIRFFNLEAGEVTPWLRTCTVLIEDSSSVPSTHTYILTPITPAIGELAPFSGPCEHLYPHSHTIRDRYIYT